MPLDGRFERYRNEQRAGVINGIKGLQSNRRGLLPTRCLHRVQKDAELASASLRQRLASFAEQECDARWSANRHLHYALARVSSTVLHWQL